jgi:hypothetical protein
VHKEKVICQNLFQVSIVVQVRTNSNFAQLERNSESRKCSTIVEYQIVNHTDVVGSSPDVSWFFFIISEYFCRSSLNLVQMVDVICKFVIRDVGNFFRHLDKLLLCHPFRVSDFSMNSFYREDIKEVQRET